MIPTLQELFMWALHLEEEPSVRIAACQALGTLEAKGPKLQHFLQERYALEPNTEVQRYVLKSHSFLKAIFFECYNLPYTHQGTLKDF